MADRLRLALTLLRAAALTGAAFWVAASWDPFYLAESTAGRANRLGRFSSLGDLVILLSPALLATGVSLVAFLDAAKVALRSDRTESAKLGPSAALGLAAVLSGGLVLVMLVLPIRGQTVVVPLRNADMAPVATVLERAVPAGELVDGSMIRQPLDPERLALPSTIRPSERWCLQFLVATYLDRENAGRLEVSIGESGGLIADIGQVAIDVRELRDNTWVSACFDDVVTQRIIGSSASVRGIDLIVQGLGAPAGQAATVWLAPALPERSEVQITGVRGAPEGTHELIHRPAVARAPAQRPWLERYGWLLIATGTWSLLLPLVPARSLRVSRVAPAPLRGEE